MTERDDDDTPKRMDDQVGGHLWSDGKQGLMRTTDKIFKPICDERGKCEKEFYEKMSPHEWLPPFYGTKKIGEIEHIVMGDLTKDLKYPCVLDLKIGKQTFAPTAAKDKRDKELAKYPRQAEVGFRVAGMRLKSRHGLVAHDRQWGREIQPDQLGRIWDEFLPRGDEQIPRDFLDQLKKLKAWRSTSVEWHLYSSSVLLFYDAANSTTATIRMIDFSYATPSKTVDANYLFGLDSAIRSLEKWFENRGNKNG
eukprot:TRINITY_DN14837_c0_g1_i1.p1 TRINITY_DN14837_c0_g1~~TRINITY_DN14837_c0_g1_i1.p1  ORF type:complete len:252 (-),score=37.88 TRINITY_DN14837_c0_g1_i1:73-828(-)